jgi:hypothetical protein
MEIASLSITSLKILLILTYMQAHGMVEAWRHLEKIPNVQFFSIDVDVKGIRAL